MHCSIVKPVLERLKKDYSELEVEEIDMASEEGQKLVQQHGIVASPGILIDGEFFASGGATETQFREKFDSVKK